jgi:hypothetical protein
MNTVFPVIPPPKDLVRGLPSGYSGERDDLEPANPQVCCMDFNPDGAYSSTRSSTRVTPRGRSATPLPWLTICATAPAASEASSKVAK